MEKSLYLLINKNVYEKQQYKSMIFVNNYKENVLIKLEQNKWMYKNVGIS